MATITIVLVKELRERTGAGMMDCKKALVEANGDIELAITKMRQTGTIKAAKKASNIAADGIIKAKIANNYAFMLEVNCQTDFVSRDSTFQKFVENVLDSTVNNHITNIEDLKAKFEQDRIMLVSKIGENINIRRIAILKGSEIDFYIHGTRIGVLIVMSNSTKKLIKEIAMHIAASKPEFIYPEDIPAEFIDKEYQLQLDIAISNGKSKEMAKKMIEGRMKKMISELSLIMQPFIFDTQKIVGNLLEEQGAKIINFIRFEVGEGIKKVKK